MLKYRKVTANDRSQLEKWIASDPEHRDKTSPEFWLPEEGDGTNRFAIEDDHGTVFYVRAENVLRLHIQFAPDERKRTAKAIDEFTKLISSGARQKKYKQLIFDSVFEPLIKFLERRGFHRSQNEQVMDL